MPKAVDHDQRRTEISEIVLAMVATDGVDAVTFRSVAEASGWSTGVLGHYYGSRHAMLLHALRQATRKAGARQRHLVLNVNPLETLVHLLEDALPTDPEKLAFARIYTFMYADALSDETFCREIETYLSRWRRAVEHAVVAAQVQGLLSPYIDPTRMAIEGVAFADGLAIHCLFNEEIRQMAMTDSPLKGWVRQYSAPMEEVRTPLQP